jgi:hypothetical protein
MGSYRQVLLDNDVNQTFSYLELLKKISTSETFTATIGLGLVRRCRYIHCFHGLTLVNKSMGSCKSLSSQAKQVSPFQSLRCWTLYWNIVVVAADLTDEQLARCQDTVAAHGSRILYLKYPFSTFEKQLVSVHILDNSQGAKKMSPVAVSSWR